jgi:hypothetical protein
MKKLKIAVISIVAIKVIFFCKHNFFTFFSIFLLLDLSSTPNQNYHRLFQSYLLHIFPNYCSFYAKKFDLNLVRKFDIQRFDVCCMVHLGCYNTCNSLKSECDEMFFECSKLFCWDLEEKKVCNKMAEEALLKLQKHGCNLFKKAQNLSCLCE